MKWFVYQVDEVNKMFFVNARTRNAANKRLAAFMKRFKLEGEPHRLCDEPLETLVHCWNEFGTIAIVVYKDD